MNISVLILGRHEEMMQRVIGYLQQQGFTSLYGVLTNEDVLQQLQTGQYDVLIIGGGVDADTRIEIAEFLKQHQLATKMVEHYGNPASLVTAIKNVL